MPKVVSSLTTLGKPRCCHPPLLISQRPHNPPMQGDACLLPPWVPSQGAPQVFWCRLLAHLQRCLQGPKAEVPACWQRGFWHPHPLGTCWPKAGLDEQAMLYRIHAAWQLPTMHVCPLRTKSTWGCSGLVLGSQAVS